jgi:hypothetical protein
VTAGDPQDQPQTGPPPASPVAPEVEVIDGPPPESERPVSSTVGTGSYVAITCTGGMLLLTFVILMILLLVRWLT